MQPLFSTSGNKDWAHNSSIPSTNCNIQLTHVTFPQGFIIIEGIFVHLIYFSQNVNKLPEVSCHSSIWWFLSIFSSLEDVRKTLKISISNGLEILICFNKNSNYFKFSADQKVVDLTCYVKTFWNYVLYSPKMPLPSLIIIWMFNFSQYPFLSLTCLLSYCLPKKNMPQRGQHNISGGKNNS